MLRGTDRSGSQHVLPVKCKNSEGQWGCRCQAAVVPLALGWAWKDKRGLMAEVRLETRQDKALLEERQCEQELLIGKLRATPGECESLV